MNIQRLVCVCVCVAKMYEIILNDDHLLNGYLILKYLCSM